ncbi:MAG TPA: DUF6624 domain-containing protein [Gemmatimonadaceae bacterium]|nr:DUF6624 domain-containing protein [Gemmatimonadaceae bacterium]
MNIRQAAIALVALMSSPTAVRAQRCAPLDTTAEWYKRQRAWLSDAKHDWSDDAFRSSLINAAGVDASHSLAVQRGVQREGEAAGSPDTALVGRLRSLASTRGSTWPTRAVVGAAGVRSVWIIAQRDTALQRTVLHRMMESGPDEALAADVAVLEDRVRLQSGRKQLYGSQLRMVGGKLVTAPIEDSAHVDMRRDAAGLPPLHLALCGAR